MLYKKVDHKLTWEEVEATPGAVVVCVPCSAEGLACHGEDLPPTGFVCSPAVFVPDLQGTAEDNAALGLWVRSMCQNDPERLRMWASAVELMWDGDLSHFLRGVAAEIERQVGEQHV